MNRLLLISVASALVSPGMAVARDQSESHGPYSVERRGNIGDLHTVYLYMLGQVATDFSAIENSGLKKKDIAALRRAADSINAEFVAAGKAHVKMLCEEAAPLVADEAAFRAKLVAFERAADDAKNDGVLRALKPLSTEAYLWLRDQVATIEFHTTYSTEVFSTTPQDAVDHGCQIMQAEGDL